MPTHLRKIKTIEFGVTPDGGTEPVQFECQIQTWSIVNNTSDPERLYFQCPEGETFEDVDPEYALELTFAADWRENGISDFLQTHDGEDVDFTLLHHPGVQGEETTWTGTVRIKAPSVGGEARTNELPEVTLQIKGKPTYERSMDDGGTG